MYHLFIYLHAATASLSMLSGCYLIFTSEPCKYGFEVYFYLLVTMLVFMTAALAVDWQQLVLAQHFIFISLEALALYMIWRAFQAREELLNQRENWHKHFINHVGFTLISFFDAFVIVGAINLDLPVWAVVIIALAGVLGGNQIVKQAESNAISGRCAT